MATVNFTNSLGLALPTDGDLDGTWGQEINEKITTLVEEAVVGVAIINDWVDATNRHDLIAIDGASAPARNAVLYLDDTTGDLSGAGELRIPNQPKTYIVNNQTGQQITVKTATGSGSVVSNGNIVQIYCDGIGNGTVYLATGSSTIIGATIDDSPIGQTTPAAGAFTALTASTIDGQIGSVSPTQGDFTNVNASGSFNGRIGASSPNQGTFTTVSATSYQGIVGNLSPNTGNFTTLTALNIDGPVGQNTAALGTFTSLVANVSTTSPTYLIAGDTVLSAGILGSSITSSSLTSVGTITSGTWQGTSIGSTFMEQGTEAFKGALRLASNAEAILGTDTAKAVTSAGVQAKIDDWDTTSTDPQARVDDAWVASVQVVNDASSAEAQPTDIQVLTQAEYDAIGTKDANTLYFIK